VGRTWPALLEHLCGSNPHLADRLAGAQERLQRPLAISNVPYGFVHRPIRGEPEGLFRLGDQVGVIPSFSGDGMAIALHTARVAAEVFRLHGNAAAEYHRRVAGEIAGQIRFASMLYDSSQNPLGRTALVAACRLHPGLLRSIAAVTRIRAAALRRALQAPAARAA
jgi:hypothetical protein